MAKTATKAQIEGYEHGADDYITKPFNTEILISRTKNLIEQRENLKKRIRIQNIEPSQMSPTSLDEQFLKKLIHLIEQNISDHQYSIENICRDIGIGHDKLYRKIKNLSGMSFNQFIRMIRLKRAAQLLNNSDLTISQILYEVGFTNPSYFTKCFKNHFGVTPKEWKKRSK